MKNMSDDDYLDEASMEIRIKTLMGTSFDMKVSSTDTVGDIKRKIYRVEGIPIYQQNLIYGSKELKDTHRLCDSGIENGAKLALVTSMRGGPIATSRRLSLACDSHVMLKELMRDLLLENTTTASSSRDSTDRLSPTTSAGMGGSKVSVLVFKDGGVVNLMRVIENEDGSYSPYEKQQTEKHDFPSPSTSSCAASTSSNSNKPSRHDTLDSDAIFERLSENDDMSTKMADLRDRMHTMNLRKLNKKMQNMRIAERDEDDDEEELALKDKHRSKTKSMYRESREMSHTRDAYVKISRKMQDKQLDVASSQFTGYFSAAQLPSSERSPLYERHIAPLPQVQSTGAKKRLRCCQCQKRLNVTNVYDCRCGKMFCAQHRYYEAHACPYDYKTADRELLRRQNPLVQAEKVHKI